MSRLFILDLLVALSDFGARQHAAARLADRLDVETVLLFVRDPVLDTLLPAIGMPQTLQAGRSWRSFLVRCGKPGRHEGEVEWPRGTERPARAVSGHGAAVVLLGGVPSIDDLDTIERVLPLLGAAFRGEQQAAMARAEATESRKAAGRAHALAEALEAARAEGSRLNIELRAEHGRKDEFLAMLAHELRNPLAPIMSCIQVLRHLDVGSSQREQHMSVIDRQVNQMARLVDDLLDVSRVTRGRVELRRQPLDLRVAVSAALETSAPAMLTRSHVVAVEMPDEPVPVHGDAVRLSQVFSNLLHNAAKYTDPGGKIQLRVRREGSHVTVEVEDNGIGLSPHSLARIFDLFMQVPVSLDRMHGGLGIGLTLVRRLVQLHDGEVTAHSAGLGRGSTFAVKLGLSVREIAPAVHSAQPRAAMAPSDPLRILVVDDNRDSADTLAVLLKLKGHHVDVAYSGAAALQRAADASPDLILLDLGLPEMNGYEVARRLLATLPRRARLVALTGYGTQEDRRRTSEAGFDEHRVKPLSPADLDDMLAAGGRESALK